MPNETHRRGRPSKGIGEHYRQVSVYLPPEMLEALDREVDRRFLRSGHAVSRTDIIRQAIIEHLEKVEAPTKRRRPTKG
jgi:metal-responsive CopG/Arc/MetJ family transcriptional regulator